MMVKPCTIALPVTHDHGIDLPTWRAILSILERRSRCSSYQKRQKRRYRNKASGGPHIGQTVKMGMYVATLRDASAGTYICTW